MTASYGHLPQRRIESESEPLPTQSDKAKSTFDEIAKTSAPTGKKEENMTSDSSMPLGTQPPVKGKTLGGGLTIGPNHILRRGFVVTPVRLIRPPIAPNTPEEKPKGSPSDEEIKKPQEEGGES